MASRRISQQDIRSLILLGTGAPLVYFFATIVFIHFLNKKKAYIILNIGSILWVRNSSFMTWHIQAQKFDGVFKL